MPNKNSDVPSVNPIDEVLKDLPEEKRKVVKKTISLHMQGIMPVQNPIYEKLTPEHITTLLDISDKASERFYKQDKFNKVIACILIIAVLSVITFVMYVFKNNIVDIHDILIALISLGAGVLGGFGLGYKKGRES